MEIKINIKNCEECPYSKAYKVYTADSFEDIRKVHCTLLKQNVHEYLEWNDDSVIPNNCPLKILF